MFEPSVSVGTRERRRKIAFQLKILLSIIVVMPLFIIWTLLYKSPAELVTDIEFFLAVSVLLIFSIGFYFTKKGKQESMAILIVIFISTIAFFLAIHNFMGLSTAYRKDDVNVLLFLLLPMLLAVSVLDIKKSIAFIGANMMGMVALPFFFPHITVYDIISGPFIFLVLVSILLLAFSQYRSKLEMDRRNDLEESEEKLKSMIESSPDGMIFSDTDTRILNCNKAVLDILGYDSKDEIIGKNSFEFISPDDMQRAKNNYEETMDKGITKNKEYKLLKKDGSTFEGVVSSGLVTGVDGEPKAIIGSIKDISDVKETERWEKLLDTVLRNDIKRGNHMIIGYLQLLLESNLEAQQCDLAKKARSAATDQNELINNIEILRNLGKEHSKGKVDPYFLLKKSIESYRPKIENLGIDIEMDIEGTHSKVVSEGRGGVLLERIFTNLFNSIVRYPGVDSINIETDESEEYVVFSFTTDGTKEMKREIRRVMNGSMQRKKMSEFCFSIYLIKNVLETFEGEFGFEDLGDGKERIDLYLKKVY